MASGSGYVLNYDLWNPMKEEDGKFKILRFSKGDVLEGVDLAEDQLEAMTSGSHPMLLKRNSEEGDRLATAREARAPGAAGVLNADVGAGADVVTTIPGPPIEEEDEKKPRKDVRGRERDTDEDEKRNASSDDSHGGMTRKR